MYVAPEMVNLMFVLALCVWNIFLPWWFPRRYIA